MTPPRTVPPALRPVVLIARMRDLLPPTELTDVLATFTPPVDPADTAWIDLCAALDAYNHASDQGLDLDEAGQQVDIAAMILDGQCRQQASSRSSTSEALASPPNRIP